MSRFVNPDGERAVLGAMLLDPDCVRGVAPKLRPDDFSLESNRAIFSAISRMHSAGDRIDAITLAEAMGNGQELRAYLAELLEITPTSANAMEYAEIVAETGANRRLRDALQNALSRMDQGDGMDLVMADLDAGLRDYNDSGVRDVLTPNEQLERFYAYRDKLEQGERTYTRTGFRRLDRILGGGMYNGAVYFLGARPGTGKTALALNIAEYVGEKIGPVCFLSMEMTDEQILARRFAQEAKINSARLMGEKLTEPEHEKLAEASVRLGQRNVFLTAKKLTVEKAAGIARTCKGCRLVVIDHFTLFLRPHREKDYAEYTEISHALDRLAKAIDAPVLCLIQLNRANEEHKGPPRLSELRGSGSTEEDAGGVLLLHQEGDEPEDDNAPRAELLTVGKNRFGKVGKVAMSFFPAINKFLETYV